MSTGGVCPYCGTYTANYCAPERAWLCGNCGTRWVDDRPLDPDTVAKAFRRCTKAFKEFAKAVRKASERASHYRQ